MALDAYKGVITSPGGTGDQAITDPGFTPAAVILWMTYLTGDGLADDGGRMTVGVGTEAGGAVQQGGISVHNNDGQGTSQVGSSYYTDALLKVTETVSGASRVTDAQCTLVSMDANGFTINWSILPATGSLKIHYLTL